MIESHKRRESELYVCVLKARKGSEILKKAMAPLNL